MNERIWFTTQQAADHAGCSYWSVVRALESGQLHGGQRTKGGTWRIHRECLHAWLLAEPCPHEATKTA